MMSSLPSKSSNKISLLLKYGTLLLNKGRKKKDIAELEKAVYVFQQCIDSDPTDFRAYYNVSLVYDAFYNLNNDSSYNNKSIDSLNEAINSIISNELDNAYGSTLSLMYGQKANHYIRLKSPDLAFDCCEKGLSYNDKCIVCITNINICMRQLGLMNEAIALTWKLLDLKEIIPNDIVDTTINTNTSLSTNGIKNYFITIYCVKWGTKYGSEYVNNLYRGISKYMNDKKTNRTINWSMKCFTDDSNDIMIPEITCLPFPDETNAWTGWWLKTAIFQNSLDNICHDSNTIQLNLYLDLDVCICGSLSFLIDLYGDNNNENGNCFYTLAAAHLKSEGRPCGINSSLILWKIDKSISWNALYEFLMTHYQSLVSGVYKLDHYLEMMLLGETKVINIILKFYS